MTLKIWIGALLLMVGGSVLAAQDEDELLRRIRESVEKESTRLREDLSELIRRELAGSRPVPKSTASLAAATAAITEELLRKDVTFLASDDLKGRASGTPGNRKATEYIAAVMAKAGLKPVGDDGTYYQKFKVGGKDTRNCLGLLEGRDPQLKEEILVIGGHHDHVGTPDSPNWGRLGRTKGDDRIWNGVDDNASGTSAVLAVIRAFGETGLRPRRSILFMTFSGEEAGLVGSRYYVRHPIAPIDRHVFMLNLDMVGRNPKKPIQVHGVGSAAGGLVRSAVENAVAGEGLNANIIDKVALVGGDSDHSSFKAAGVPFSFFFSGFHADYHRVTDHADKVAYPRLTKVARASLRILVELADGEERPRFVGRSGGRFGFRDPGPPVKAPRRLGVTVMELDDEECKDLGLSEDVGGLRVDYVRVDSAADAAGLKAGDVILSLADEVIPRSGGLERLRKILQGDVKPGRDVPLRVHRDGAEKVLRAKWKE